MAYLLARPAGLEPATYGLEELGSALTNARIRLNARFDARRRSPTIMGAVTMFGTDSRCVPDPEILLAPHG